MADKQSLFGTPFTDYALIANDGQEIRVHKAILHIESDMFKALFSNVSMKDENSMQTSCDYEDLLKVVRWMYGFDIEFTESVYVVADKLMVKRLLDWKLYIPKISSIYVDRFVSIIKGEIEKTIIEERNYNYIYECVVRKIAISHYAMRKLNTKLKTYDVSILLKCPLKLIKRWYKSKYRVNSATDLVIFADKYASVVGYEVVREHLIPLIDYSRAEIVIVKEYVANVHDKFPSLSSNTIQNNTYLRLLACRYKASLLINYIATLRKSYKEMSRIVVKTAHGVILNLKDVVSEEEYEDFLTFSVRVAPKYLL